MLLLPAAEAAQLEQAALDRRRALGLLGASYSANAYAFGLRHQNCNQWLAELLASASMQALLDDMATRYPDRIILFDSPPLLLTTESRVLASHMGQVVVVVHAGSTLQATVQQALMTIESCPVKLMVLNKTDLLPHLDFDVPKCIEYARRVNPGIEVLLVSAKTGQGLEAWLEWLTDGLAAPPRHAEPAAAGAAA